MKKIGLDLGSKTLGIAISDAIGLMAHGVETFRFAEGRDDEAISYVAAMAQKEKVTKIILGFPKNMNGTIGERGEITKQFAEKLKAATGVPVILWDERMTTMQVERVLIEADVSRKKRKKVIDKMAATIILQSYLDSIGM